MLSLVRLVDQFNDLVQAMADDWSELELELAPEDENSLDRAAALLGPATPGRFGRRLRFTAVRSGGGVRPEATRRLLRRLDADGIRGRLSLLDVERAKPGEPARKQSLRAQWEQALGALPADWSDLYAEVRLVSSDYVERAALLLAPVNPAADGGIATLRFRCARRFGYGVSPGMAARCFERCDEEGITGTVEILRALSDTQPIGTQGPVWLVGGRVV